MAAAQLSSPPATRVCQPYCRCVTREAQPIRHLLKQKALLKLVEWTGEWPVRRLILVCTDSQSALSALREGDVKGHTILVRLYRLLHVSPHDFVFQWVPGHCGLPGNERADEEAGKAAGDNSLDILNQMPIPFR